MCACVCMCVHMLEPLHSHKCWVSGSIHQHVHLLGIEAHIDTIVVHDNEYDWELVPVGQVEYSRMLEVDI